MPKIKWQTFLKFFVFVLILDTFYNYNKNFKRPKAADTLIHLFCIKFDMKQFAASLYDNC